MNKEYDALIKVVIVGESTVGKSNLTDRFGGELKDPFQEIPPTIGADFKIRSNFIVNKKNCRLQMWDCTGNERFRQIVLAYARSAQVFVLVYDVTNRESFDKLQGWYEDAIELAPGAQCIVVGNKADLKDQRQVAQKDAQAYAESIGAQFAEVSAKTGVQEELDSVMVNAIPQLQADDSPRVVVEGAPETKAVQAINAYAGILERLNPKISILNDNQKRLEKAEKLKAYIDPEGDFLDSNKLEDLQKLLGARRFNRDNPNAYPKDTTLIDNSNKFGIKFFKTWSKIRGYENAVTGEACESKSEYLLSEAYRAMTK